MLHLTLITLFSISLGVIVLVLFNASIIIIGAMRHNQTIKISSIAIAGPVAITALLYQLSLIY
jgi:hypothetical protein